MPSSKGSFWPRDWTQVSCIAGRSFTTEPPGNWTRVSCIAGGVFTNWAIREDPLDQYYLKRLKPGILTPSYVSDSILGSEDIAVTKTDKVPALIDVIFLWRGDCLCFVLYNTAFVLYIYIYMYVIDVIWYVFEFINIHYNIYLNML